MSRTRPAAKTGITLHSLWLLAALAVGGYALSRSGVHEQLSTALSAAAVEPAPTVARPPAALPTTRTVYRWVDHRGLVGFSHELPDGVQDYRSIVLPRGAASP